MALTRLDAEGVLVARTRRLLDAATFQATATGANPDLNNALADTLMQFGVTPASLLAVADADLAGLGAGQVRPYLDYAELRLKRDILAAVEVLVTQSAETSYTNLSDIAMRLQRDVAADQERLDQKYLGGLGRAVFAPAAHPRAGGPHGTPARWGCWP